MDPIDNSAQRFLDAITTPPKTKEENISRIPKKEKKDTFDSATRSAIINTAVTSMGATIGTIPGLWFPGTPSQPEKPRTTPTAPTPPAAPTDK